MLPLGPIAVAPRPSLSVNADGWRILTQEGDLFRTRALRRTGSRATALAPVASRRLPMGRDSYEGAVASCTGKYVAFTLDREPGIELVIVDGRTLSTRRKVRLGIDVRPSWAPEDTLIALFKSYGYGVGHLSILNPKTGGARRVSNAADFIWWSSPQHGVIVGSIADPDNPVVTPNYKGPIPYGVPKDLTDATRGRIVTLEGMLYSNQGRYGAYISASDMSHTPGFEDARDTVWTKSRGRRSVSNAFPIGADGVVEVWTSPNRLLVAGVDSAGPMLAVQALESGAVNYRLRGLRPNETVIGFVRP